MKIRQSLPGKVNENQNDYDVTLAEKIEGEIATKREVKKVLAKGFEMTND